MINTNKIEEIMLGVGNSFDDSICGNLMWQNNFGWADIEAPIQDSGKAGDERIYRTLKWMEKEWGTKL